MKLMVFLPTLRLLAGVLFLAFSPCAQAAQCSLCNKALTGKYLRIGSLVVHPQCFKCNHCGKNIQNNYRNEENAFFHPECHRQKQGLVCGHCGKVLGQSWITSSGKHYHEECYRNFIQPKCAVCNKAISDQYAEDNGRKFHVQCYKQHKLPKCSFCNIPLEGVHLKDPWGNVYHGSHRGQDTPTCFSCARVISQQSSNGGVRLADGRSLCSFCHKYAIKELSQVAPHFRAALETLRKVGISGIPKDLTIELVDRRELARRTNGLSYHIEGGMRGLTLSEETLVGKKRKSTKHSIYLLQHMATLELEGVLAHELMHVWLFENKIKLTSAETEGFCNLGNYLTYSKIPSPMSAHFLQSLDADKDPVYGDGYRMMKIRLDQEGWLKLLNSIKERNRP